MTLNQLTTTRNEQLSQKLNALEQNNSEINIVPLDANALFTELAANPDKFGSTNVADACLTNFQPSFQFEGVCDNPDRFLFWDDVHPTAQTHRLINNFVIAMLEAEAPVSVPESYSLVPLWILGPIGDLKYRWDNLSHAIGCCKTCIKSSHTL